MLCLRNLIKPIIPQVYQSSTKLLRDIIIADPCHTANTSLVLFMVNIIDSIVVIVAAVVEMWSCNLLNILLRLFHKNSSISTFITFMINISDYYLFFNAPGHLSSLFHLFTFALF